MACNKALALRLSTDVFAIVAVAVAMAVLQRIKPFNFGYFEGDESLSYPCISSTIPSLAMYIFTFFLITLTILYAIYDFTITVLYGYMLTIALADLGKVVVGRLRPNFMKKCDPNPDGPVGDYKFVSDYSCQGVSGKEVYALQKSFPSGHAATSIYTAVILCLYLQMRLPYCKAVAVLRPAYQIALIATALYVCYTRIANNKHFWTDVLAGIILATLVAFSTTQFIPGLFKPRKTEQERPDPPPRDLPDDHDRESGVNQVETPKVITRSSDLFDSPPAWELTAQQ